MAKIEVGETIIIILREPREKIWGVLGEINASGVYLRGIDLNAFDDFVRALQSGEDFFGLSEQFLPMWRIERISKDETSGSIPALHEQFEKRTGLLLGEI